MEANEHPQNPTETVPSPVGAQPGFAAGHNSVQLLDETRTAGSRHRALRNLLPIFPEHSRHMAGPWSDGTCWPMLPENE